MLRALFFLFFVFVTVACARSPIKSSSEALRFTSPPSVMDEGMFDDESYESLMMGLKIQVEYWQKKPAGELIAFGPQSVSVAEYLEALEWLLLSSSKEDFVRRVKESFDFYEVYGADKWGEVLVTGYYESQIKGVLRPNSQYSQSLYKLPPDLVNINVGAFQKISPHWSLFFDSYETGLRSSLFLRGRYLPTSSPDQPAQIVPYFSREQIDSEGALKDKNLEIVFVDPIDAFFLQIQGSGQVELPSGKVLRLGYASQNGHPYVAIGKFLSDVIEKESMSKQSIEAYMRTQLNADGRQSLMNRNPSYVFFRKLEGPPLTASGTEVVPGRTIATDSGLFPKGALAFLRFQKPTAEGLMPSARWVFDQDTGGAIKGPGRVDLFCGTGRSAEEMAGVMRHPGALWYLVPKKKAARLSSMKNGPNGRE